MLSSLQLFVTPWNAASQAPLSSTISWNLFKLMSIESVMLSNHLILCHPLLLLSSIFPSIRVFSSEWGLFHWVGSLHQVPKVLDLQLQHQFFQWYSGLMSLKTDWFDILAVQESLKSLLQHHSLKASILWYSAFFMVQLSHPCMATRKTIALTMQTFVGKVMPLLFNALSSFSYSFPTKKQLSSSFTVAITICSNFRAQEEKICHYFHLLPLYSLWKMLVDNSGPDNHHKISVSWVLSPF